MKQHAPGSSVKENEDTFSSLDSTLLEIARLLLESTLQLGEQEELTDSNEAKAAPAGQTTSDISLVRRDGKKDQAGERMEQE